MQQLSTMDAMFAYTETSTSPMHIGQLLIYNPATAPGGKVGFKDILRYIESRLDGARIFRQKLVRVPLDLDHPYWVEDENFDLEYHVRHIALPRPGDWRQLCIQAARIYSRPLDMNRPLWEITVIEGLDDVEGCEKGSFAMLHKLHHAAIDGKSGLEFSLALHDTDPDMNPREFNKDWEAESDPKALDLLFRAQLNNIMNPIRGVQTLQKLLPVPKRLLDFQRNFKKLEDHSDGCPKTRFNKPVGPHRVLDACTFPLADIKTIRTAFPGTTVNDVALAIVGGSMRAYLEDKGELPEISLKVGAPVSVRTEEEKNAAGNQVSMMTVGVGSHIESSGERLNYVMDETARSKAMTQAIGARTLVDLSKAMPAGLTAAGTKMAMRLGLSETLNPQINTIVTNVPGPQVQMYFAGARLDLTFGTGLVMDGIGLFHAITSYNGDMIVTFLADRDMMPDPAFYAAKVSESFNDLLAVAMKKNRKPNVRRKKAKAKKTI